MIFYATVELVRRFPNAYLRSSSSEFSGPVDFPWCSRVVTNFKLCQITALKGFDHRIRFESVGHLKLQLKLVWTSYAANGASVAIDEISDDVGFSICKFSKDEVRIRA